MRQSNKYPRRFATIQTIVAVIQLIATVALAVVATMQAQAANAQTRAAAKQAATADLTYKQSIRPRLTPAQWIPAENGEGALWVQSVGPGTAYALHWRFEKEWQWSDLGDIIHLGDRVELIIHQALADRRIVVEYSALDGETFSVTVNPITLAYEYYEPVSPTLIADLRAKQRGTKR